ncbi:hypothetical protein AMAG_14488 [Allomyces macrogynus ATCC 38327]|uniref:Flavoprotein pyridine nucleotide cytochrome reductase-like FAD-binding domain-containing protein n=1 Tax=Allomyces macrogynus (strain ATCC 38327) TaxID=578462 RepID=A0A0L0T6C7_ALLM3|nr:hypothetical protein AMAG_14488 [Allomyces macrogynus ATCC 38327]|eukprot:KNE70348.1 hypothetical protein AMAG_14488 [Allomyces macrogynus ATCC 38327]
MAVGPARSTATTTAVDRRWALVDRVASLAYWSTAASIACFISIYLVGQHIVLRKEHHDYTNHTNYTGFVIHAISGSIYFLLGLVQFHAPTRQAYPTLHRALGWIYTILSLLAAAGVLTILAGGAMAAESAVIGTAVFLPAWLWVQYLAIRAIQVGDVALHRRHQLRAFAFACSIMAMRPAAAVIMIFKLGSMKEMWRWVEDDFAHPGEALKTALWAVFTVAIVATEAFLAWEDSAVETVAVVPTGMGVAVVPAGAKGAIASLAVPTARAVKSVVVTQLTPRTIHAVLTLADGPYLVVPGQHVAVTATQPDSLIDTALTREYSPVTHPSRALSHYEVELVIRLVPGGAMSARWRAPDVWTWSLTFVPVVPNCAMQRAIAAKNAPVMLVSLGTGATPFVNVIRALAAERRRVHVVQVHRAIEDMFWTADEWEAMGVDEQLVTSEQRIGRISAQDLVEKVREVDGKGKPEVAGWRVLVSGPQQAARELTMATRKALGWDEHRIAAVGIDDR